MSKMTAVERRERFISKAKTVHGDKYDYSLVDYRTCKDKVKIICPIHGVFEQTPDKHTNEGNGCPGCRVARIQATVRERYGVDYISQLSSFQEKVTETCIEKYGVRRPMQNPDIKQKSIETSRKRWGCDYPMQNDEVKARFRKVFMELYGVDVPFKSSEFLEKARATMIEHYGVVNPMQIADARAKAEVTLMDRYGVTNPAYLPDFKERCEKSSLEHWGVLHPMQDMSVRNKQFASRMENGIANVSSGEEEIYLQLCDKFGVDDVFRQYISDVYSFHCDFYVKSLDLYIELNGNWTHGFHWFDENNADDVQTALSWSDKALSGSKYYSNALYVWTVMDLMKRAAAVANNLNYIVFWDAKLSDFYDWFNAFNDTHILKQF